MAVLLVKQCGTLHIIEGGSFNVYRVERLIQRYRLNRRLCGSYRQSGGLEKRFETSRLQDSNR